MFFSPHRTNISVRAQLTAIFTALFGIIVIALACAVYLVVKHDAYSQLDAALQVATSSTAMSAAHEFNEHSTKRGGELDVQLVLEEIGNAGLHETEILVREGARNAAYKASAQHSLDLRGISSSALTNGANLDGFRVATRSFHVPKFNAVYQIYAVQPIHPALSELRDVEWSLILFVPIGLAFAGLGGYLLAMRSLRPLQQLAQTVDAVSSSDLSARVQITQKGDEIGRLGERFNCLLDRLEAAFHLQRRFMADASHQIRTPVTVALAAAQVTARDPLADTHQCRDSLQIVEKQMLQLRRIVEDMFFLSQSDTGLLKVQSEPVYLDEVVSEAVRAARTLASAKRQSIRMSSLPEAACLGDEDLLKQAVLILLDNAVKFTAPEGHIQVDLRQREAVWVCSVTDDGPGISAEAQTRIFDRFFQERRAGSGSTPGSGLGLAIAKSILQSHGGVLSLLESRPGKTVFELSVPATASVYSDAPQENWLAVRM